MNTAGKLVGYARVSSAVSRNGKWRGSVIVKWRVRSR